MVVGEIFEKNGRQYEVTELLPNGNYAFKPAAVKPVAIVEDTKPEVRTRRKKG